jgi:hypothetical protein
MNLPWFRNRQAEKTPAISDSSTNTVQPPPIAGLELLQCVGRGGYGEVWLAKSAVIGAFRAVKIVYRERFSEDRPFLRELDAIRKFDPVSRTHPGLLHLLHADRSGPPECFYYIMEPADDEVHGQAIDPKCYRPKTLSSVLARQGRLPVEECLRLGLWLTSALSHLHQHGLVHRDIKPANIIYRNGAPQLADIGLVTEINLGASVVGTPGYMAEDTGNPSSDLFSVGKVLFVAVTGADVRGFPRPPAGFAESDTHQFRELNRIFLRACAPSPQDRYPAAEAMYSDLEAALGIIARARPIPPVTQGTERVEDLGLFGPNVRSATPARITPRAVRVALATLEPQILDAHLIRGKTGSGYGIEILLTNPGPERLRIRRANLGCFRHRKGVCYHAPPRPVTYELELALGVGPDKDTWLITGEAKEPGDDWARPASGGVTVTGAHHAEFYVACPFYLELAPVERALVRFVLGDPTIARAGTPLDRQPLTAVPTNHALEMAPASGKCAESFWEALAKGKAGRWSDSLGTGQSWVALVTDEGKFIGKFFGNHELLTIFHGKFGEFEPDLFCPGVSPGYGPGRGKASGAAGDSPTV